MYMAKEHVLLESEDSRLAAKCALELSKEIGILTTQLDAKKEFLRLLADGKLSNIIVEGLGEVIISSPRKAGTPTKILVLNQDKLNEDPELKKKLLEKGILSEEQKQTPAAKASVTIKLNK